MKMNKFVPVAALAAMMTVSASATILYSFEDGLQGWDKLNSGDPGTLTQDTIGATTGSHSLKYEWPGGWYPIRTYDTMTNGQADALKLGTKFYFDLYIPEGGMTGQWLEVGAIFNDAKGWRQMANLTKLSPTAGKYLVTVDYSELAPPDTSGWWFEFILVFNTQNVTSPTKKFYIDSIRTTEAVPEPASMIALGAGALALIAKRKRR
jgi:hypothetical protein